MHIKNIHITSYGGKKNIDLSLSEGLNVIFGRNESGKSTIADFIRFMLYGPEKSLKDRYRPLSTETMSGTMTLSDGGHEYIIERTDGMKKTCHIFCDGGEVKTKLTPGEYFFGVPGEVFVQTAYVGQKNGTGIDGAKTAEAVQNLLNSGDENISAKKAADSLTKLRRELYPQGKGGSIRELENRISALNAEKYESLQINRRVFGIKNEIAGLREKSDAFDAELAKAEGERLDYLVLCRRSGEEYVSGLERDFHRAQDEADEYEKKYSRNDRFPTDNDLDVLKYAENGVDGSKRELDNAVSALEEAEIIAEKANSEFDAAVEGAKPEIARRKKLKMMFACFGAAFIVLFLLTVCFGIVAMLVWEKTAAGILLLGTAVVCFVLAGISIRLNTLQPEKIRRLGEQKEKRDALRDAALKLELASQEKQRRETAFSEAKDKLNVLAERWGIEAEDASGIMAGIIDEKEKLSKIAGDKKKLFVNEKLALHKKVADNILPEDDGREISLPEGYNERSYGKRCEEITAGKCAVADKIQAAEREIIRQTAAYRECAAIEEEINSIKPQFEALKEKYEAVSLALDGLSHAGGEMRNSLFPSVSAEAGRHFGVITDHRYDKLDIDSGLGVTFSMTDGENSAVRNSEYMSGGTFDAAYLSIRLALGAVTAKKKLPLVLDETLSKMDDGRMTACLDMFEKSGQQVVLFTSCRREQQNIESSGIGGCVIEI